MSNTHAAILRDLTVRRSFEKVREAVSSCLLPELLENRFLPESYENCHQRQPLDPAAEYYRLRFRCRLAVSVVRHVQHGGRYTRHDRVSIVIQYLPGLFIRKFYLRLKTPQVRDMVYEMVPVFGGPESAPQAAELLKRFDGHRPESRLDRDSTPHCGASMEVTRAANNAAIAEPYWQ